MKKETTASKDLKTYSVSVDTTSFYVEIEAKDEDEAVEKVREELYKGTYYPQQEETYFEIGLDVQEVKN